MMGGWPCSSLVGTPAQSMVEESLEVDSVNSVHNDAAQKRDPPTKSLISSFLLELAVFKLGLVLGALLAGAAHTSIVGHVDD